MTTGVENQTAAATANRRAIARRALVLVGIIAFVFGVLLPRAVDIDAVRAALAELTAGQLTLLGGVTAVAYVASAGPYRVLVPHLSWRRAVGSDLAARAVVTTVPGPSDVATRVLLYRQWSIPAAEASAGVVLATLFESLAFLTLPLIAVPGLLVVGEPTRGQSLFVAFVGLVALVVAAVLVGSMVQSEALARRLGESLDRVARKISSLFRRTAPSGIVQGTLDLREQLRGLLTDRGRRGFLAALAAKLAWFVVLEACLWCVGITPDLLSPAVVLTSMAVVGIVSLVPITPGAVGVAEVVYIGILSAAAGGNVTEQLTAAVMLFRIAQWLGPIPIGWILLIAMRWGQGSLLGSRGTAVTDAAA
jgi:uncharacterized protein (TIRG00374 family)